MNRYVFSFLLLVAMVACVAVAVVPLSQAKATNMTAQNSGLARIAAAEAAAAEAKARQTAAAAEAATAERQAISPALQVAGQAMVAVVAVVAVVGGAGFGVIALAVTYSQVQHNKSLATLPVTRQIAPGVYVFQEDGRNWLLDSMTGRRALLSSAADVDALRAGIIRDQVLMQEIGKTAVEVARHTRNGQQVTDWLFSNAMMRIGNNQGVTE